MVGRKVEVEADSMVELILGRESAVSESGVGGTLSCWEMEDDGRISPVVLISVVGEIGAGVLNSNALYEREECSDSEEGSCS